jgi:hypothetical protein
MNGWGVRPYNWEFSVGVQQQIVPRLSLSFGYFRRINGNFYVLDNEALGPNDFTQFSVTVPSDSRLPNAGQTISGLYDQNAIVAPRNVIKGASQFGTQRQHWDGLDLTLDARLQNGWLLQGGVSTGKTMTDNCAIVARVPAMLQFPAAGLPAGIQNPVAVVTGGVLTPASYCHQETPFLALYKALASYTFPWGIRASGTLQSLPGPQVVSNVIYNNMNRVSSTSLARPFTLAQANVNVIQPGSYYGDRLNQIDLRFTKILNVGGGKIDLDVDLYNAFNSDAVISELGSFGLAWRLPLTVSQPRFVKFAVRYDF